MTSLLLAVLLSAGADLKPVYDQITQRHGEAGHLGVVRPTLKSGKDRAIDGLGVRGVAQDKPAARSAQRLVRRRGDDLGMAHRAWMDATGDQAGDVRNIGEKKRAAGAGDFAHAGKVDHARIRARADRDHLRLMFARHRRELIVINPLVALAHAVMNDLKELAGEICLIPMRQMSTVAQIHREHLVTGLQHGIINRHVRTGTGMWLDVGVFRTEKFFRAVNRQLFNGIYVLASSYVDNSYNCRYPCLVYRLKPSAPSIQFFIFFVIFNKHFIILLKQ